MAEENEKFTHNIEDIVTQFNTRKDTVKRKLATFGFQINQDYTITKIKKPDGGRSSEKIMVTKRVYDQILLNFAIRTRQIVNTTDMNIQYIKRYIPEETETINFIYDTLSPFFILEKQYKVLQYRIDLYIIDKKIAIECDEKDHKDRDPEYETKREMDISKELDCIFIRFNPNDKKFKLTTFMSSLIPMVSDLKLKYIVAEKEEEKKELNFKDGTQIVYIYDVDTRLLNTLKKIRIGTTKYHHNFTINDETPHGRIVFSVELPKTDVAVYEEMLLSVLSRYHIGNEILKMNIEFAKIIITDMINIILLSNIQDEKKKLQKLRKIVEYQNKILHTRSVSTQTD